MKNETVKIDEAMNLMLMSRHMELNALNELYCYATSAQNPYIISQEATEKLEAKIVKTSIEKQQILNEIEQKYKPNDKAISFNVVFETCEAIFNINEL